MAPLFSETSGYSDNIHRCFDRLPLSAVGLALSKVTFGRMWPQGVMIHHDFRPFQECDFLEVAGISPARSHKRFSLTTESVFDGNVKFIIPNSQTLGHVNYPIYST